jgi:hypothetical protein
MLHLLRPWRHACRELAHTRTRVPALNPVSLAVRSAFDAKAVGHGRAVNLLSTLVQDDIDEASKLVSALKMRLGDSAMAAAMALRFRAHKYFGAPTRSPTEFLSFVDTLIDQSGKFKMTTAQLDTFMSDSVAARCADPDFMRSIEGLLGDPFNMTTAQLVTFMSNSVAARCADPRFLRYVARLIGDPYNMTTAQLVTFMSGSAASRCADPDFMRFVERLLGDPYNMTTAQLVTFMNGSVAVRCADPDFMCFIELLLGDPYNMTTDELVTFMSGSVASRCADPDFMCFVELLLGDPYNMTTAELVTFMSGSVAVRCADPDFMCFVEGLLGDPYNMTTDQLVKFMSNSVAVAVGKDSKLFQEYLDAVVLKLGLQASITLFSRDAFSSRYREIVDIGLFDLFDFLQAKLGAFSATEYVSLLGKGPKIHNFAVVRAYLEGSANRTDLDHRIKTLKFSGSNRYQLEKEFVTSLAKKYGSTSVAPSKTP